MLDRLFGRGKQDQPAEPTCAACGRTLLPGEWAQTFVRDDGVEEIVCSLCSQSQGYVTEPPGPYEQAGAPAAPDAGPAVRPEPAPDLFDHSAVGVGGDAYAHAAAPVVEAQGAAQWAATEAGAATEPVATIGEPEPAGGDRTESDTFWRALKDKDAEIARLQAEVMRLEAERRELGAQLEQARQVAAPVPATAPYEPPISPELVWQTEGDAPSSPQPGTSQPVADAFSAPVMPEVADEWSTAVTPETTTEPHLGVPPQPSVDTDIPVDLSVPPAPEAPSLYEAAEHSPIDTTTASDAPDAPVAAVVDMPTEPIEVLAAQAQPAVPEEWCPVCDTAEIPEVQPATAAVESEEGTVQMPIAPGRPAPVVEDQPVSLVFEPQPEPIDLVPLQRGADLFNVSDMPQKVAETNELLGLPRVNLSVEEKTMTAVFIWSMAWYEYTIDLDDGDVRLKDRGYEDRTDLAANGTVRPDGTVQLIPLPTRRPVVQAPPPAPAPDVPVEPAPAPPAANDEGGDLRPVDAGKGEFISKSLRGQRTDDEAVAWDEMAARDFDWGH
jgi:hypothetical protein